ncbi:MULTISPECIES: hypothetical protein [Bacilli]|uniref:hypothetical protein n=1 Tax=Bacilli TaxID=91061 RepID=UPI0025572DB9|nr:hypothetical protein [Streptococcus agalactiae]MDK8746876.1 hypothetical protein [Streptococcus agalactiae]
MNCSNCTKGVLEFVGYLNFYMGGTVTYQPELYRDKEKLSTSIQICSFCGDTKFTSHPKLLTELKREIRESQYHFVK